MRAPARGVMKKSGDGAATNRPPFRAMRARIRKKNRVLPIRKRFSIPLLLFMWVGLLSPQVRAGDLPEGFVYVEERIPDVKVELRYFSRDNFVGETIDGYLAPRCILSEKAALSLQKVQNDLKSFGLGLKIYDAYRPQRAVDHFVRWARNVKDTRMKKQYYPDVNKSDLFKLGYIADKSGHSRGGSVDVTIVAPDGRGQFEELDMGSPFDFFGTLSWPSNLSVSPSQRAHRMLLREVMGKHGFAPYPEEWWHFTLRNEPFPDTYFDFPVR